ncbi:hypothetical protein G9A89_012859 [Geosiphon pyriformis]|nr:hypothetical protein G9A89_012859 [Geosiphon pyriformis]
MIPGPPIKRLKVTAACLTCRKKKVKCTGPPLCSRCEELQMECQFDTNKKKRGPPKSNFDIIRSREDRIEIILSTIDDAYLQKQDPDFKRKLKSEILETKGNLAPGVLKVIEKAPKISSAMSIETHTNQGPSILQVSPSKTQYYPSKQQQKANQHYQTTIIPKSPYDSSLSNFVYFDDSCQTHSPKQPHSVYQQLSPTFDACNNSFTEAHIGDPWINKARPSHNKKLPPLCKPNKEVHISSLEPISALTSLSDLDSLVNVSPMQLLDAPLNLENFSTQLPPLHKILQGGVPTPSNSLRNDTANEFTSRSTTNVFNDNNPELYKMDDQQKAGSKHWFSPDSSILPSIWKEIMDENVIIKNIENQEIPPYQSTP